MSQACHKRVTSSFRPNQEFYRTTEPNLYRTEPNLIDNYTFLWSVRSNVNKKTFICCALAQVTLKTDKLVFFLKKNLKNYFIFLPFCSSKYEKFPSSVRFGTTPILTEPPNLAELHRTCDFTELTEPNRTFGRTLVTSVSQVCHKWLCKALFYFKRSPSLFPYHSWDMEKTKSWLLRLYCTLQDLHHFSPIVGGTWPSNKIDSFGPT